MKIKSRIAQSAPTFLSRWALVALVCAVMANVPAWADCTPASLGALNVPNMTISSATVVPAATPNPEYCDVKGTVTTTGEGAENGSANFEVMLPTNWNQKFIFHGVGGLAGTLSSSANPADQALFLPRGYATAITDTGHLVANPTWEYTAPGEPDMPKVIDYYYRAVHDVTLAAKMLVKNYYHAETIRRSYFDGCSNGGKMGMIEAGRYPADYDGIISGAPWLDPVGTSLWSLKNIKALLEAYIPAAKFQAVSAAILKQCDKADGVADGLIQNPAKCAFQPDALVPETLTQKQADALKLIMNPVRDEQGKIIFPGASVGNLGQDNITVRGATNYLETPPSDPTSAKPWGDATVPANWSLSQNILMKLGFRDGGKDMNNSVESNGVVKSDALNLVYTRLAADVPNDPSKLSAYFAKGGKLLIYHGFDDLIISPYSSIWFYEDLAQENGGYPKLQQSARLFMVPGMQHCVLGAGPNSFDTLSALEQWVEKGIAPDAIPATHLANGVVDRTMPLCKFPEQAHYKGSGDAKSVASWSCKADDKSLLAVGPNGTQAGANAVAPARVRPSALLASKSGN
ncbi:MAG TPA: tannase/feruloyl esterase family alpha/beta hydrolase [Candidatus Saccharimonadales bacterium]|jgi:feruloyl esterase|nr:tannase/feruloyl esterase family alpha/beta hydrolase [Candidatus Saccharimonadales bacterium]